MAGSILQLIARGSEDIFISNNPEITHFKIVYRRHTNFSMYPKILSFTETVDFGKSCKCKIKHFGDLVSNIYLAIELPEIKLKTTEFSLNELIELLNAYDISINHDFDINFTNEKLFNIIKLHVENKIIELLDQFNNEYDIELKTQIIKHIYKIGFKNNSQWYFPSYKDFINDNFKHNSLTSKLLLMFSKSKFAWVKELVHYLIETVEIKIGGITIDKYNSDIMHCENIIYNNENKEHKYNEMIGNINELFDYDSFIKPKKTLYIPLKFWFCKHFSEALPIVALSHTDVNILIKFRKLKEVSVCNNYNFIAKPKLHAYLIVNYVYVDNDERKRLCKDKHEYLIEKHGITQSEIFGSNNLISSSNINFMPGNILNNIYSIEYKLNFNFSTKQIYWIIQPYDNNNNKTDKFNWIFYDKNTKKYYPLSGMNIKINGKDRESVQPYGVYQYWQSEKHNCSSLVENLFLYNLALYPSELQPSGTINFGKINDAKIIMYLNDKLTEMIEKYNYKFRVSCYCIEYNILRISNGIAGLVFV